MALGFCSIVGWAYLDTWPKEVIAVNSLPNYDTFGSSVGSQTGSLIINLLFLYFITLKGICTVYVRRYHEL